MRRGQAAIEFMFILLIVILFIFTATKPTIDFAMLVTEDTATLIRTSNETQRIADAIIDVYLLGEGSKKTLEVFIPTGGEIYCDNIDPDKGLWFLVKLKAKPFPEKNFDSASCTDPRDCCNPDNGICTKEVLTESDFGGSFPIICNPAVEKIVSGKHSIEVLKNDSDQVEVSMVE